MRNDDQETFKQPMKWIVMLVVIMLVLALWAGK